GDKVAVVGQPFTMTVQARDLDQNPLSLSESGLPAAATLTPSSVYGTATLTWTPTGADARAYTVVFQATDNGNGNPSLAATGTRQIRLIVRDTNSAPVFATTPTPTVAEEQPLSVSLKGSDPEGDSLTYTTQHLPDGATLDPQTGVL